MADPAEGLEPDVTTIEDEASRKAEQMEYYGGDIDADLDDDLSSLDRGDDPTADNEERGDDVQADATEEDDAEDATDEAADEEDADSDDDDDDAADSEQDDDTGDQGDADDEDDDDDDEGEVEAELESEDSEERDPGIPRHRFNEVNERRKAAERELEELRAQKTAQAEATVEQFDFDAAENEYMELLLDGKTQEAGAKRREIRTAEQEIFKNEARQETVADVNQQAELSDLNELSIQAEEMYPMFDEGSAEYDPVVSAKVITYMKGYAADGQSLSDAFVSGLADVIEQYDLNGTRAAEAEKAPAQKKVTKGKPIKKVKDKLKAAKQQGKSPAGVGDGSADRGITAPSIEDMSDSDLENLDAKSLARMRGDYVD